MKIVIASDIHNNIANLKKVLHYCAQNQIKKIICCGDLASLETLDFLNDNFSGEIFYCFGNMDDGQMRSYDFEEKYKKTWIFRDYGETKLDSSQIREEPNSVKNVAFVHYPEKARELCQTGKYNYVFYGHTHKPWEEKINNCKMINPGNVAGEIYPPTFCIWDTESDKFDLIRINDFNVIPSEVEESN